jgi:hypothetical protein
MQKMKEISTDKICCKQKYFIPINDREGSLKFLIHIFPEDSSFNSSSSISEIVTG